MNVKSCTHNKTSLESARYKIEDNVFEFMELWIDQPKRRERGVMAGGILLCSSFCFLMKQE